MRRPICLLSLLAAFAVLFSPLDPALAQPPHKVYLPLVNKPSQALKVQGISLAEPVNNGMVRDVGFGYIKYHIKWSDDEQADNNYNWKNDPIGWEDSFAGNFVRDTDPSLKIILRVDSPPAWANGTGEVCKPPHNFAKYGEFLRELSTYLRVKYPGRVVGYEIWNEPNLTSEWCGEPVSPSRYVALLEQAYNGIRQGDPQALVISAGMATTGGGGGSMNDVDFIRGIYAAGGKSFFDVLGSHPYGFGSEPETAPWGAGILFFRRAEAQRQVMMENGDGAKQVWATEFNWLISVNGCQDWKMVSPEQQGDYLVRAFKYARNNWPWMGPMFVFNMDFDHQWYYGACDTMRGYSITDRNLVPRPAYHYLKAYGQGS